MRTQITSILYWLSAGVVLGFNGHVVTEGPLRIAIGEVAAIREYDDPGQVRVTATNSGTADIEVEFALTGLVDEWRAVGPAKQHVVVPAGGSESLAFQIAADPGAYAALYPVRVRSDFSADGYDYVAEAVRIFEAQFERVTADGVEDRELEQIAIPDVGVIPLTGTKDYQAGWAYLGGEEVRMPVGWQGEAQSSRATFFIRQVTRGESREALNLHPAWQPGAGIAFVEYRLKLPPTTPIALSFGNAIRDNGSSEPPSDGVTFRVRIDSELVFERHMASRRWADSTVDLSEYAGRKIRLRLECHPGPQNDTTCDSAFWGAPVIVVGDRPDIPPAEAYDRLRVRARTIVESDRAEEAGEFLLPLPDGMSAGIVVGPNGLVDGAIALGWKATALVFDGLEVSILGDRAAGPSSPVLVTGIKAEKTPDGSIRIMHHCLMNGRKFPLAVYVVREGAGLRLRVECPERITDLAIGRSSNRAQRVYYGHGYCIEEPQAFRAGYGGHNLSTSHVGFEFENGIALLMACDNPPDYLEVNPDAHRYALHTHMPGTLTLLPGRQGIMDCARQYRELDARRPSPGFASKAGRFVFDVWGGRYAGNTRLMQQMLDYGLRDSMLTLHVWQRWGYDYRLPDIYPPNPELGTLEDLQTLGAVCDAADIPWGLHDNYIDFYPDAEGFSYDHICFTEGGSPVKAWLNTGRDAQSYRFRPDHILPFVQRNLRLIGPNLHPSHYFIDVFTSINLFDYYDREGRFHSSLETRRHWGEAFQWIQDYLGAGTITTSEAGDDQLIGYLDGADCQHLNLAPEGAYFQNRVPCRDWERWPWFDAVLHDRFSLHGVGYPGRYEGGRSRLRHGIESDDYLSDEILLGHALMIDRSSMPRGAVRKYWLAQDFIRSIATDRIADVRFAANDIHRITVTWESGAIVHVNRGESDWSIAGKILPQYGFHAESGPISASIERRSGVIVEHASSSSNLYVNARGVDPDPGLAITPQARELHYLGARRFALPITWQVKNPVPGDLAVHLEFKSPRSPRYDKTAFTSAYHPDTGSSIRQGKIVTGANNPIEIPAEYSTGEYAVHLSLIDRATGNRYGLDAEETGHHRYLLGKLVAEGDGAEVSMIRFVPQPTAARPEARWNVEQNPIDFGTATTTGAFRCQIQGDHLLVIPLPNEPSFEMTLDPTSMTDTQDARVTSIHAVDPDRGTQRNVPFTPTGSQIRFSTHPGEFAYRIALEFPAESR